VQEQIQWWLFTPNFAVSKHFRFSERLSALMNSFLAVVNLLRLINNNRDDVAAEKLPSTLLLPLGL
jgi:hypothetical protein